MADVIVKNIEGEDVVYEDVTTVSLDTTDGGTATFTLGGSVSVNADYAQTDSNANDYIKNRPFYEDEINIEWDGTTDGDSFVGNDPMFPSYTTTFQKVSDNVYSIEELETFNITYINTISSTTATHKINSTNITQLELIADNLIALRTYNWCTGYILWVALEDGAYYEHSVSNKMTFPTKGVYFAHVVSDDGTDAIRPANLNGIVLKQIDVKFLPNTVAMNSDVATAVADKVDKVTGKGLSTNDFTDEYKNTLDTVQTELDAGKVLSTNDFTDEYKQKIDDLANANTESAEQVQSDYSQHNMHETDYIKNRPFYEDYAVVIESKEYECGTTGSQNDVNYIMGLIQDFNEPLMPERMYKVTFAGTEYVLKSVALPIGDDNTVCLGNAYKYVQICGKLDSVEVEETNEPFVLMCDNTADISFIGFVILDQTATANYTLEVILDDIKKIDKKFLPDDIGIGSTVTESALPEVTTDDNGKVLKVVGGIWQVGEDETTVAMEEVDILSERDITVALNSNFNKYQWGETDAFILVDGEEYIIEFDGETYTCTASLMTAGTMSGIGAGNQGILGNGEDTGEPFLIGYLPDNSFSGVFTNDTAEAIHTIRIYQLKEASNETFNGKISWDNITDKPFYEEVIDFTYDGNYANYEYVELDGMYLIKVSDHPLTLEEAIGGTLEVCTVADDGTTYESYTITSDMYGQEDGVYFIALTSDGIPFVLIATEETTDGVITVQKGTYIYDFGALGMYTSKFQTSSPILKQLDAKFIPNSASVQSDWDETDETSPAYIKNKPVIGADGSVTVQSNWNQNDNTQGDYIKNRPFYDYIAEEKIFEGQELSFIMNSTFGKYNWGETNAFILEDGKKYKIIWDETEYICTAQPMIAGTIVGIGVGNQAVLGIGDDTGEPFLCGYITGNGFSGFFSNDTVEATHTVIIYQYVDAVKQIDDKYIPESARGIRPDWNINDITLKSHILNRPFYAEDESGDVDVIPSAEYTFTNYEFQIDMSTYDLPKEGNIFKIVWDGSEYECTVVKFTMDTDVAYVLGNFYDYMCIAIQNTPEIANYFDLNSINKSNEPFLFILQEVDMEKVLIVFDIQSLKNATENINHTFSLTQLDYGIHKIDKKFLPYNLIADWQYMRNKPFYSSVENVNLLPESSLDFNYEGLVPNSDKGASIYVVTATTEIMSQYNDTKYNKAKVIIDGISYESEFKYYQGIKYLGNISLILSGVDNGEPFIVMLQDTNFTIMYLNETTDHEMSEIITHTVEFTLISENIKKIDDVYQHQADWNESNTNKASYIKNKPFGVIGETLLEDTTVTPIESSETIYAGYGTYAGLVAGETYTVTFNDKDYILQAQQGESETHIVIGYETEDTSEVVFYIQEDIQSDGSKIQIVMWKNVDTCKLQIYKGEKKIKKIPIEYLPDDVGGMPDASEEDEGKFMRVVGGQAVWATVLSAEGVRF